MGKLAAILKLIRFPNLVIIAATQYAMRHLVMEPLLPSDYFTLQLGDLHFGLLVFSTICIAAAGYIINDYFDTRADLINKPHRVTIGMTVGRRIAMTTHAVLNFIGVALGVYLGFHIGLPVLGAVFLLAAGLLWFYSTSYKRQFLIGNLTVAFLTGLVPLMTVMFEIPLLNRTYGRIMLENDASFSYMAAWVGGFGFFAFLTTLIREIVKDTEDFEGDSAYGMRTVPIVFGIRGTKALVVSLAVLTAAALLFMLFRYIVFSVDPADLISAGYFLLFLILPLLLLAILVVRARGKRDYHRASLLVKWIMLAGILYAGVVYYLVNFRY